jgi:hypothetical protein
MWPDILTSWTERGHRAGGWGERPVCRPFCLHVPSFAIYQQDDLPSTALFPKRVCFRRIA